MQYSSVLDYKWLMKARIIKLFMKIQSNKTSDIKTNIAVVFKPQHYYTWFEYVNMSNMSIKFIIIPCNTMHIFHIIYITLLAVANDQHSLFNMTMYQITKNPQFHQWLKYCPSPLQWPMVNYFGPTCGNEGIGLCGIPDDRWPDIATFGPSRI